MSNGGVRSPTIEDVDPVHNLIEQCLQLYLSKTDAVNLIFKEANIDPGFTELVWAQLEQDNPEFFKFYYIRLALKQQIELFNGLLRDQARLTQQVANGGASSPGSNGSHVSGNGTYMPGNGSGMLGNGYHTSGNGSHGQEDSYHRPENGSLSQENGSHRPVNGAYSPINGSHWPGNGSHRPENGAHRPVNGVHDPINGSHRPENGSHRSVNGVHGPINGSHRPENGSHRPVNGVHGPINRSHRPENGSHRPVNGVHGPINGSHRPENGSHRPVNGVHGPINGSHRSENGSHQPVNGAHGPPNGSHRPEIGAHRPVNGAHMPVHGSHRQHLEQNGHCYPTDEARNSQAAISSNIPCAFSGMSMLQTPTPSDVPTLAGGINLQDNYQNSNSTRLTHGLNEGIIRSGSDYSDSQQAIFNPNGNVVGTRGTLERSPFGYVEASSHMLNQSLLAVNDSSHGHFGQIPGDFSFSALSTAYPSILENYANSAFDTTNAGNFFVSQDRINIPEDISGDISDSFNS